MARREWQNGGNGFPMGEKEIFVKSKERVTEHGEVFTPPHIVDTMLDLVKGESERIDSRFLESACGEGNFLKQVLRRKLSTVQQKYGKNEFERRHYALLALMCVYGIELLEDNADACRDVLSTIFQEFLGSADADQWIRAAHVVLRVNIVCADALTMKTLGGNPLTFPEWGYLGRGKFQRRDFEYAILARRSLYEANRFEELKENELFVPVKSYKPMTVHELADLGNA